tara:strand:- start:524 stop:1153 length:630 start_codon:yes stop_codon:yes gene_type:complete
MKVNVVEDSTNTDEEIEYLNFVKQINKNLENINYKLLLNENESIFKVEKAMKIDENDRQIKLATRLGGGRGEYYTNFISKKILQKADGFGQLFLISSNLKDFKWKITKEKKIINGKQTYKAILMNENVENKTYAWFCPDIPSTTGPLGYGNLPGLILELHLKNGFAFYANRIVISSDVIEITPPAKGNKVTREEFEKIEEEAMNNIKKG